MIQARRRADLKEFLKKNQFEQASWAQNRVVCGIDEVGRGCLAGPLVTAAVILPPHKISPLLKDSKVLTAEERLKAFAWIEKHCWYGVGIVHNRIVDKHNVWQATLIAMKRALVHTLSSCPFTPESILIDAMPLDLWDTSYNDIPVHYFPQGERKSSSIAAASIVAKVRRDELMRSFDAIFPGYHLADHKGYSTEKHKNALLQQKYSIIHRRSFLNFLTQQPTESSHEEEQQRLC